MHSKLFPCIVPFLLILVGSAPVFAETEMIEIDEAQIVRRFENQPVGININPLMDADSKRQPNSRLLTDALEEMGVKVLRFPEGELGDDYLWATPPFPAQFALSPQWALRGPKNWPSNDPKFSTSDYKPRPDIMSFDVFMDICQKTRADPILIVPYDSAYKKVQPGSIKPTIEQLKISAVEWVRYANFTRGWNIRHWEIGNESDIAPEAYGGADPGAKQYAQDLAAFSSAMKAVDPTIKIGLNFWGDQRLTELLAITDLWPSVDYISLHNYPSSGWNKGYEEFRKEESDLVSGLRHANALIDASGIKEADKSRLRILVTETNAVNWSKEKAWANIGDMGHALVEFEIIRQSLLQPRVDSVLQWVTRWTHNDETNKPREVFDSLDQSNKLTPMGEIVALFGKHFRKNLVKTSGTASVNAVASTSVSGDGISIFMVNKERESKRINLSIKNCPQYEQGHLWSMNGLSPEARTFNSQDREVRLAEGTLKEITLDPLSVTVIELTTDTSNSTFLTHP